MTLVRNISSTVATRSIDWLLFFAVIPIIGAGLITMYSFIPQETCVSPVVSTADTDLGAISCADISEGGRFFKRQLVWIIVSVFLFFAGSFVDWRFLRRSDVLFALFLAGTVILSFLFIAGKVVKGAQSWFDFGSFSLQPVEPVKLLLILILAKYFSRRHIEIKHIRHILTSGVYALILFMLVLLQPDFGGAVVIFCIWLGMVLLSGISKKHLLAVFLIGALSGLFLWAFVFKDYQKQRLITFIHPFADIQGSGYNANQSMIAVGSGEFFGKGVGMGSQSRLQFLPEYETDFMFAAFAEEWGFFGVVVLFALYALLIWRILLSAFYGQSNFEILYGLGLALFIMAQVAIHIGMNIGLLPVTGISLPFMSYGGTQLATLFLGLGILMGMQRYKRAAHKDMMQNEFVGVSE